MVEESSEYSNNLESEGAENDPDLTTERQGRKRMRSASDNNEVGALNKIPRGKDQSTIIWCKDCHKVMTSQNALEKHRETDHPEKPEQNDKVV